MHGLNARLARLERHLEAQKTESQGDVVPRLIESLFPEQRAFVLDSAKRKATNCTRRSGKTWSDGAMIVRCGLESPGCTMLYIGLTRDSAKRALIRDVIVPLDRTYALGLKINKVDLTVEFPNGSMLYILGLDSAERYKDRLLGGKYSLVILDEAQSFGIDVKDLVENTVGPACVDLGGQIVLSGTPGNLLKTYYHDVCHGLVKGWSFHHWGALDNPSMAKQWQAEIDQKLAEGLEHDPGFRQNYLGEWTIESEALVYRYSSARNLYDALPSNLSPTGWHRVLGVDLGYDDDSAFSVGAYHDNATNLWIELAEKEPGLDITGVAERIRLYQSRYDLDEVVVDGANKQAIEEMRNRHGLPLQTAEKQAKADFIDLMNADFARGVILLQREQTKPLQDEYLALIWDPRAKDRKEHPKFPNHSADSSLYLWRKCRQYLSEPLPNKPPKGTPEYYAQQSREEDQLALQQLRQRQQQQLMRESIYSRRRF